MPQNICPNVPCTPIFHNRPLRQSVSVKTNDIQGYPAVTLIRYWGLDSSDLHKLIQSIVQSLHDTSAVIVGINVDEDKSQSTSKISQVFPNNRSLHVLQISPWRSVTHALNLIVHHALQLFPSVPFLLIRSCEVSVAPHVVHTLVNVLEQYAHALVAGAALPGHHQVPFSLLERSQRTVNVPLNGVTVPWNTLALWRAETLRLTGFPLVADLLSPPGMEEVAALALHHKLFRSADTQAFLVSFRSPDSPSTATSSVKPAIEWHCCFGNSDRTEKHRLKMQSKNERTDKILQLLHVSPNDLEVTIISHSNACIRFSES